MISKVAVWLHGDSLSVEDPALRANPDAPALFVFDEALLRARQLSFKRLFFLYECALEALEDRDGEIRRGAIVAELIAFCRERDCNELHVSASVAPLFREYLAALRQQGLTVVVHQVQPLVDWRGSLPRRFSAFWRKVEHEAMRPTGDGPPELRGLS